MIITRLLSPVPASRPIDLEGISQYKMLFPCFDRCIDDQTSDKPAVLMTKMKRETRHVIGRI